MVSLTACKEEDAHSGHYIDMTESNEYLDSLLGHLNENTANTIVSNQPTVKATQSTGNRVIIATGYIGFDERRNNAVAARIGGRIEELFVRYNYQYVRKGQPILALYSPVLNTFMEQHLLLSSSEEHREMRKLSREKLLLLGMSQSQINQMEKQGRPLKKVIFYSPYGGYIRFGNPTAAKGNAQPMQQNTGGGMAGMDGGSAASAGKSTSTGTELQPGSYVAEGQTLFTVNDMTQVWALLSIPSEDLVSLEVGMPVQLQVEGVQQPIQSKIDFIEPAFSTDGKFGRVRIYLPNQQKKLAYNALVSAEIQSSGSSGIFVPVSAVYNLGRQKIVWKKTGTTGEAHVFTATPVTTGAEINGNIQILSGLEAGAEVAENASYLLDSEGQIQLKL